MTEPGQNPMVTVRIRVEAQIDGYKHISAQERVLTMTANDYGCLDFGPLVNADIRTCARMVVSHYTKDEPR